MPNQIASNIVAGNQPGKNPDRPEGSTNTDNNGSGSSGNNTIEGTDKPNIGESTDKPSTGGGNTGGEATDIPTLPPLTPSDPDREKTTCENFKPGLHQLGNTGLCFNTYEEAKEWSKQQSINPDSPWFGYRFVLGTISNYPDSKLDDPWTITANK